MFYQGLFIFKYSAIAATSLSPRPEIFTIIILSLSSLGALLITSAKACELSIAGIIPSF